MTINPSSCNPKFSRGHSVKLFGCALACSLSVALSGCGSDGLELNGRLFDLMGVSESAQKAASREPKLNARSGLVMPPNTASLPEPGSGGGEPDVAAVLNDPERKKQAAVAERARLHKAYCSGEMTWKERAANKDQGAPISPYGSCTMAGEILKQ